MDLYFITGSTFGGAHSSAEYVETVHVLREVEEKPKCYTKHRTKINKSKIDTVEKRTFPGSYQMIVTDKEKINEARRQVKERVLRYNVNELRKYQEKIQALENHDFTEELEIEKY